MKNLIAAIAITFGIFASPCVLFANKNHCNHDPMHKQDKIYVDLKDLVSDSGGFWFNSPVKKRNFSGHFYGLT